MNSRHETSTERIIGVIGLFIMTTLIIIGILVVYAELEYFGILFIFMGVVGFGIIWITQFGSLANKPLKIQKVKHN